MSNTKELMTKEDENVICPFCKEDGFDKKGLKYHLIHYCDIYNNITFDKTWASIPQLISNLK